MSWPLLEVTFWFRAFLEAFPDDSVEIRKRMAEFKTDSEDVSVENKMDTATLYDPDGNLCLPVVRNR